MPDSAAAQVMSNALNEVVQTFLQPGTSVKVIPIANVALIVLLVVLIVSAMTWSETAVVVHLVAMSIIASLLLVTLNWCARQSMK